MKKKAAAAVLAAAVVIICAAVIFVKLADGADKNIVDKDSVDVLLRAEESSIDDGDNEIKLTLTVKNHNRFDINLFESRYQDKDLYFELPCESVCFDIEAGGTVSFELKATFDSGISSADYITVLREKEILFSFDTEADITNGARITQIQPSIEIE